MLDFYELLKAAKTGFFPPDASYYDMKRAQAIRKSIERKRSERKPDSDREPEQQPDAQPDETERNPDT